MPLPASVSMATPLAMVEKHTKEGHCLTANSTLALRCLTFGLITVSCLLRGEIPAFPPVLYLISCLCTFCRHGEVVVLGQLMASKFGGKPSHSRQNDHFSQPIIITARGMTGYCHLLASFYLALRKCEGFVGFSLITNSKSRPFLPILAFTAASSPSGWVFFISNHEQMCNPFDPM